jgi:hypothetical protein
MGCIVGGAPDRERFAMAQSIRPVSCNRRCGESIAHRFLVSLTSCFRTGGNTRIWWRDHRREKG